MEKCPKCGNYTVTVDAYRGIIRCIADVCDYIDKETLGPGRCNSLYSRDNYNPNPKFLEFFKEKRERQT